MFHGLETICNHHGHESNLVSVYYLRRNPRHLPTDRQFDALDGSTRAFNYSLRLVPFASRPCIDSFGSLHLVCSPLSSSDEADVNGSCDRMSAKLANSICDCCLGMCGSGIPPDVPRKRSNRLWELWESKRGSFISGVLISR